MRSIIILCVMLLIPGCVGVPDHVNECPELYETEEDIERCVERVIKKEKYEFKQRELEIRKSQCVYPNFWNVINRTCGMADTWWLL